MEITPFKLFGLKNDDYQLEVQLFISARCVCLAWIIVNTVFTFLKKRTPNEVASFQTVYGLYTSLIVMVCQIISIHNNVVLLNVIPFSIDDLNKPEVMDAFWQIRGTAYNFKIMVFLDSICVFFCIVGMITMLRNVIKAIDSSLNAIQSGAGLLVMILVIWLVYVFGLTCWSVSLYGMHDGRYSTMLNAKLHSYYNSAFINQDGNLHGHEEFHSRAEFFSSCMIALMFYFLQVIFIVSAFQAIMSQEYSFCLKAESVPPVTQNGAYEVDPHLEVPIRNTVELKWQEFVDWIIKWYPRK